jgi:hypothetical protein
MRQHETAHNHLRLADEHVEAMLGEQGFTQTGKLQVQVRLCRAVVAAILAVAEAIESK